MLNRILGGILVCGVVSILYEMEGAMFLRVILTVAVASFLVYRIFKK